MRLPLIVNQTMKIARNSATPTSSSSHCIATHLRALAACAALALALVACAPQRFFEPAPAARFTPVDYSDLPGWRDDSMREAWPAWLGACHARSAGSTAADPWATPCARARELDARDDATVRAFFEREFTPYRMTTREGDDAGLVTGYFEPSLSGSRTRHGRFQTPLHRPPDDLLHVELDALFPALAGARVRGRRVGNRVVPYWTRTEIVAKGASLDRFAIVYVDDPLAAFFLEVQGAGRIALDDGNVVRLAYADQNGHPYRAIGRVLVERGALAREDVTLPSITAWARAHPVETPALLDENPSYVFFRELDPATRADEGPPGTLGVPLVAGRSVAVDPRTVPLGTPLFLDTRRPSDDAPLDRLVVALDTGGAIRGPLRFDYFWGFGDDAAREAGLMKARGRAWVLWPRGAPPPS